MIELTYDQKFVKSARLKLGLTQAEFAELLKPKIGRVSQSAVADWERGYRNPQLPVILEIRRLLDDY